MGLLQRLLDFIYSSTPTPTELDDPSSKSRCQRCKLKHKACDENHPCQRCSDAGIGVERCIPEEKRRVREKEAAL
jgi:hypothetical protein